MRFSNNWRLSIFSNEIICVNYRILYLFSKLKGDVKVQRDETLTLRKALHSCSALRSVNVSSLRDYWRLAMLSNEII